MENIGKELEAKHGFKCKIDYDKNYKTDKFDTLKIATYKKKVIGNLEIHVTNSYNFVAAEWKYTNTTIEICQGSEYQELKINSLEELLTLINILSGSPWQKIYQKVEN